MSTALVTSRLLESRPCIRATGRKPNKVMFIGEAPGADEEKLGIPFVGYAGRELDRMAMEAGWNPGEPYKTNVFWTRPINNQLASIFLPGAEFKVSHKAEPPGHPFKIDNKVHYLPPVFRSELERLRQEIEEVNPNLIVALGATALWALTGRQNISSMRGTVLASTTTSKPYKVLPTYHPSAVNRQWDLRTIVVADLMKAKRQAEFPEIRRPRRLVLCYPTLADIREWWRTTLSDTCSCLASDVETRRGQITEIGFASSSSNSLVIPFIKGYKEPYWKTVEEEVQAVLLTKEILQSPIPKVFQNGLYDIQYIWRNWGFAPRNCVHDTMIRHHALYPEMQKGLGFLGSLHTEEPAWKMMRLKKETEGKSDDE